MSDGVFAGLCPQAQQALLNAVKVAGAASTTLQADEDPVVRAWLGEAPPNPAELEFQALRARFVMRRELLRQCIGTTEVVSLLGLRNRQTPLDRIRAGTLLAIRDQGKRRLTRPHYRYYVFNYRINNLYVTTKSPQPPFQSFIANSRPRGRTGRRPCLCNFCK